MAGTRARLVFVALLSLPSAVIFASASVESARGGSSASQPPQPERPARQSVVDGPVPSLPTTFTYDLRNSALTSGDAKATVVYSPGSDMEMVSLAIVTSLQLSPTDTAALANFMAAAGQCLVPGQPCMRREDDPDAPMLVMSGEHVLALLHHYGTIK